MKTVKFSLNELMSEIDESFIEEVYFHDCNKILKKYSKLHTATFRGHQGRVLRPDRAILSGQS